MSFCFGYAENQASRMRDRPRGDSVTLMPCVPCEYQGETLDLFATRQK